MIDFLFKGLIRDKSRSFFPVIIITLIVSIIIFFSGFLNGVYNSLFLNTAILNSGHVKVVTHAYNLEHQLLPNDLALLDINSKLNQLENTYEDYIWTPRITFAGLLDVPDENGETPTSARERFKEAPRANPYSDEPLQFAPRLAHGGATKED